MAQRAAGAAILVMLLVLLLLKQRQAKAIPAARSSEAKAEGPARTRAPKEKSGRAVSFGRAKKGKRRADSPTPAAEPKATSGRMVPRLPAAEVGGDPGDLTVGSSDPQTDPTAGAPATEATDGMISEPGWPTPGEVWASPDSVNGYGAGEQSWETSTGTTEHDDPLTALTETPDADAAGWSESEEPADEDAPVWEKEQAEFDWTATDAETAWSASEPDEADETDEAAHEADEATDEISSAQAAWEAPEDDTATWSAEDLWEMPKDDPAEEAAPVATAVAEEELTVAGWTIPETTVEPVAVEEPTEVDHTPTIVWDPVDELEEIGPEVESGAEVEETPMAIAATEPAEMPEMSEPVSIEVQMPAFTFPVAAESAIEEEAMPEPVAEEEHVVADEVVSEPAEEEHTPGVAPETPDLEIAPEPMAEVLAPEPVAEEEHPGADEVAVEPIAEVIPEPVAEEQHPDVAEVVVEPIAEVIPEVVPAPVVETPQPFLVEEIRGLDAPSLDDEDVFEFDMFDAEEELVPMGTAIADPAARWASMMPGGAQQVSADPVSSWSRLQPGAPTLASVPHATAEAPQTRAPKAAPTAAPGMEWWDVPSGIESDPRRGRFALGGYALQSGHQVVSGVTFRDGVVPPPSHWVIGPVVGAVAPGTLVLEVEGCLNCQPQDVEVLMDHGFAPTTDGFSLRLTASETGPFAASGTFVIR